MNRNRKAGAKWSIITIPVTLFSGSLAFAADEDPLLIAVQSAKFMPIKKKQSPGSTPTRPNSISSTTRSGLPPRQHLATKDSRRFERDGDGSHRFRLKHATDDFDKNLSVSASVSHRCPVLSIILV